ncbi:hypothetical protein J6590_028275 [Homalodisca vitripennis]|nr:hypothetical protein J6590_028275 [Homalodisca vitripennis]
MAAVNKFVLNTCRPVSLLHSNMDVVSSPPPSHTEPPGPGDVFTCCLLLLQARPQQYILVTMYFVSAVCCYFRHDRNSTY